MRKKNNSKTVKQAVKPVEVKKEETVAQPVSEPKADAKADVKAEVEKAVEKTTEKVEKAVEKTTEKVAEKAAEVKADVKDTVKKRNAIGPRHVGQAGLAVILGDLLQSRPHQRVAADGFRAALQHLVLGLHHLDLLCNGAAGGDWGKPDTRRTGTAGLA